ncbi:MAG TPA: hypothetical protein VN678_11780 [Acidobacteriaceae bacterium]|nr:hypothetical protein [Acidobacteriaceae bacterium]
MNVAHQKGGSDLPLVSLAVVLGVILLTAKRIVNSAMPGVFVVGLLAAATGIVFTYTQVKARRTGRLWAKYQDDTIVARILDRMYWKGQTAEQLCDALGSPDRIVEQMTITFRRELWVYRRRKIEITLDDGVVSTWSKGG